MARCHVLDCSIGAFAACVISSITSAAFISPTWTRPASDGAASAALTTYQAYDVMSDDDGDPNNGVQDSTPDVADINPVGSASLASTIGFLTGSGNLYNPTAIIDVALTVPNYGLGSGYVTKFLLQIETQGNPLLEDLSHFTVNGTPLTDFSAVYTQVSSTPGSPLGAVIDHAIEFTVPGNAASYLIAWTPTDGSVSHRQIAVDTAVVAVVPEPSAGVVMAMGLAALARRRR